MLRNTLIYGLALFLAVGLLYGGFLHNPIVFDDMYLFIVDNEGHSAIEQFATRQLTDLRMLPYATLAWTTKLAGFDLLPLRIENLLLHGCVVMVLALFVLRLYRAVLPGSASANSMPAVFIVAGLFALHPVAVYAVAYLAQRTIVMATLFSVLTLWAYLHGSAERSKFWLWLSVALYFLATHSKEHVVMLPFVIAAMTILLHEDWRARLRENWLVFLAYAAVGLLTLYQIRYAVGNAYELNSSEMLEGGWSEHAQLYSVLTQCWLFFKYGLLWLLPNFRWMSVDMREPLAQGVFSVYGLALSAYLLYGVLAIRLLTRRGQAGLIGFAMLFPWLMFMTEFSTVRIQEIFVLYRSYLWAIGGVILLPMLLMRLNVRVTVMVSLLFAATLFMISIERLSTFSHPVLLWEDAAKLVADRQELPGAGRIHFNLGLAWMNAGVLDRALPELQTATRLSPWLSAAFANLGVAYSRQHQHALAIQAYSRAIELDQQHKAAPNAMNYYNRALSYEAQQQWREAMIDYKVSCLLTGKTGCDKTNLQ